jgi:hypothetical protein
MSHIREEKILNLISILGKEIQKFHWQNETKSQELRDFNILLEELKENKQ